ncbi:MAG: exo-alpha-sialidase [Verrucomicrobiales bacterium]|nr:exo-alpha-sialidase [Verrucomicrobiales bacterium]
MKRILLLGLLMLATPTRELAEGAELLSVQQLSGPAPHCAFTDLIRWRDRFWCVFREGAAHVSPDGAIRILSSADGSVWTPVGRLTSAQGDLRDPHLSATPDGSLMVYGAVALPQPGSAKHQSLAWFTPDGEHWSQETSIGDPNVWMWRVAWRGPEALGVGYDTEGERFVRLYSTRDGRRFETLLPTLFSDPNPNESGLAYLPDGTALCLLRRDGQPGTGKLGVSRPPYRDWTWKDLGVRIGGPQLLRLPDGRIVAAGRLYDGGARTALGWLDPETARLSEFLKLPGGGDCSYPGLVWHDGLLWVSYYSSHETGTRVYLARVRLPAVPQDLPSSPKLPRP